MTIAFIFWLILLLWALFGFYGHYNTPAGQPGRRVVIGGDFVLFVLLFLIGWKLFGWPIHDSGDPPPSRNTVYVR
jgi:hypothetical protein